MQDALIAEQARRKRETDRKRLLERSDARTGHHGDAVDDTTATDADAA